MLDFIRTAAPFACLVVAGACAAVTLFNLRRIERARRFGQWPDTVPPASAFSPAARPAKAGSAGRAAARVTTGLALGIIVGEALSFFVLPAGMY